MTELDLARGSKALVIVAHPDDETIWMGGTILDFPKVKWLVLCLTRASDSDRAPKFRAVCNHLTCQGTILNMEDEGGLNIRESVPEIRQHIQDYCQNRAFGAVFTHGANGEYGHSRHKATSQAVRQLIREKKLKAERLFLFSYCLPEGEFAAKPKLPARFLHTLSPARVQEKKRIVRHLYGFSRQSFEVQSCAQLEPFNVL